MQILPLYQMALSGSPTHSKHNAHWIPLLQNSTNPTVTSLPKLQLSTLHSQFSSVTIDETPSVISSLKRRKSFGSDNIGNKILTTLPNIFILIPLHYHQCRLGTQYFTRAWKLATITWISKAGNTPQHVFNYLSISLLPSLTEVTDKSILKRLGEVTVFFVVPNTASEGGLGTVIKFVVLSKTS